MRPDTQAILDTIVTLATEIGRRCPDCADQAATIASLAGRLGTETPDRGTIRDVLDAEMSDTDLSETQVRQTAEAVARAVVRDL